MADNSFYNGEQGYSWQVNHHYETYGNMIENAANLQYGELCIISKNAPEELQDDYEGAIYRHIYDKDFVFICKIPRGYGIISIEPQYPTVSELSGNAEIGDLGYKDGYLYVCIYKGEIEGNGIEGEPFGIYIGSDNKTAWECIGKKDDYPNSIILNWEQNDQDLLIKTNQYEFTDILGKKYIKEISNDNKLTLLSIKSLVTLEKTANGIVYALYSNEEGDTKRDYVYHQPNSDTIVTFKKLTWQNLAINGYTYKFYNVFTTEAELKLSHPTGEDLGILAYVQETQTFYIWKDVPSPGLWIDIEGITDVQHIGVGPRVDTLSSNSVWFETTDEEPEKLIQLHAFDDNGSRLIKISTEGLYINMTSNLNLEQELKLGGLKEITIRRHGKTEVTEDNKETYCNIDIGTIIPAHTAILELYAGDYKIHYLIFYRTLEENQSYPEFLGKENTLGYIRLFKGNMSEISNLVKVKFITYTGDNTIKIIEEVL